MNRTLPVAAEEVVGRTPARNAPLHHAPVTPLRPSHEARTRRRSCQKHTEGKLEAAAALGHKVF